MNAVISNNKYKEMIVQSLAGKIHDASTDSEYNQANAFMFSR